MSRAQLMRQQAQRVASSIRQAFRAVLSRNNHKSALIGMDAEGLAGEQVVAELVQHYGFASAPLPGCELVVVPIGGKSGHAIVVASDDVRYRIKLVDGEMAIYSDEGDYVHLKRGRVIELVTETFLIKASKKVSFETPLIETSGEVQAEGNIQSAAEVIDQLRSMQADRDIYNVHQHGNGPVPTQQQ
ncbi:phage baseplate assembly protein domain-containing protein [Pseudomonas taetrolens]|uniref:phage baseplate assembly protein domain-containing protein n=1 Tax=Pseudomonas taetrolens TaxID=47884 RepID=UPI0030D7ECA0